MWGKAGLYTFVYGKRIDNTDPPIFLKFRSSKAFITATIALAVFTVSYPCTAVKVALFSQFLGHIPLLTGSSCIAIRANRKTGRGPERRAKMDCSIFEYLRSGIGYWIPYLHPSLDQ
jgi:hypothetical protein